MKRRASIASSQLPVSDGSNLVQITPLGAGQEVGRSCIILKYQGRSVMFDCGIHPGYSGVNSLPYLDGNEDVDISTVDVALITHFHLDHCAAVPYLLSKTRFKGRVFMTHPTKAIYHSLLKDFARGGKGSADEGLYGESELDASMERIEVVDFLQTLEVAGGIKVTPFRAGHVLGAAMFMVEIAGMRCLYTGDYSRVPDRHLPGADTPHIQPDIVIVESTYGVSRHLPREQREELFLQRVVDTLRGGGRVLLPVVAMGRSQELLLLLDEYWEAHPELAAVPIYQASGQMRKGMRVYETYVEMMNDDIKAVFQHHNPFAFRHVTHLKSAAHFDDVGPCVLMATPSGLQSGASRDAFEAWCEDKRNTVIICDFAVQGTLAREILGGPKDILTRTGYRKTLRCGVAHISFSAHADYDQTSGFLDEVRPPHVVLVHGEKTEMGRLKVALDKRAQELGIPRTLYTPAVMQSVQISHQPLRLVRVAGRLAEKPLRQGQHLSGVLVAAGGGGQGTGQGSGAGGARGAAPQQLLLHPDDLHLYTKLHRGRLTQRQALSTSQPWPALRLALELMFEGVEGSGQLSVTGLTSHSTNTPKQPAPPGPSTGPPPPPSACTSPHSAALAAAESSPQAAEVVPAPAAQTPATETAGAVGHAAALGQGPGQGVGGVGSNGVAVEVKAEEGEGRVVRAAPHAALHTTAAHEGSSAATAPAAASVTPASEEAVGAAKQAPAATSPASGLPHTASATGGAARSAAGGAAGGAAGAQGQQGLGAALVPEVMAVRVGDLVNVTYKPANPRCGYDSHVMVEWEGGKVPDMVADAVIAVLLQAGMGSSSNALDAAEAALRAARDMSDSSAAATAELNAVAALLAAQFGPARVDAELGVAYVEVGAPCVSEMEGFEPGTVVDAVPATPASITLMPAASGAGGVKVACDDPAVKARLTKAVTRLLEALRPICMEL